MSFSFTKGEKRDVGIAAMVTGTFLWPVPATIELFTGIATVTPLAAFGLAYWTTGVLPWNANFPTFARGYMTGAAVFAVGMMIQAKDLQLALSGELDSVQGRAIYAAEQTVKSDLQSWCADGTNASKFPGALICPQLKNFSL